MKKIILFSALFLGIFYFNFSYAADTGSLFPASSSDSNLIGTSAWTNIANIKVEDGVISSNVVTENGSHYAVGTNYGFSIPTNATITGVKVEYKIRKRACNIGSTLDDNSVKLFYNGSTLGSEQSPYLGWPTTLSWRTYGGENNLWGSSLTPAIVNSSTFGAGLSAIGVSSGEALYQCTGWIDATKITVYYSTSPAAPVQTFFQRHRNKFVNFLSFIFQDIL
jgi:hypothetical protein